MEGGDSCGFQISNFKFQNFSCWPLVPPGLALRAGSRGYSGCHPARRGSSLHFFGKMEDGSWKQTTPTGSNTVAQGKRSRSRGRVSPWVRLQRRSRPGCPVGGISTGSPVETRWVWVRTTPGQKPRKARKKFRPEQFPDFERRSNLGGGIGAKQPRVALIPLKRDSQPLGYVVEPRWGSPGPAGTTTLPIPPVWMGEKPYGKLLP